MSGGWRGQTVQNRAKKLLLQGVYTHVRPVVIAFCSAKPCKTSYYSSAYINIDTGVMALCGPKPCKCPFRVWGPRQTKRVGRTIEKRNSPGTLGRPVLKKKSETPPDPLGEPLKNETPPGPVGRTIEKRNPSRARWADQWAPHPKPLQARWANQYLKKSETPPDPLGEPVLKNESSRARWANH